MKKILLVFLALMLLSQIKAQRLSTFGVTALYDFQTNGMGIDGRALVNVYSNLFIVPRLSYYPSFNNIHEWYGGADLSWFIFKKKKWNPYVFTGLYYNNWMNSEKFSSEKQNNVSLEPGVGLLFKKKCITPFAEARYNTKWKECTIGVGILLKFGECFGLNGFSGNMTKGKRKAIDCPSF